MPTSIKLKQIRIDGGTQSRIKLNERHLQHLLEVLEDDGRLAPIEVIYDGTDYWLWDGFHRVEVYRRAARPTIPAHIEQGTQRDAILKSCGANGKHGLPRCNADKRRAVLRVLSDAEWSKWSDREIARQCAVSHQYVANLRSTVTVNVDSEERIFTTKHGTVSTMNVAPIIAAHKTPPTDTPDWATICKPEKSYMINWVDRFVIDEPFDNHFEAKRAYPLKNHRPERGVYIIAHPEIYNTYTLRRPASADESTSPDLPDSPAVDEPATPPVTVGETPAHEAQAIHAAGLDDSQSPDEPTKPALTIHPDKWYPIKHTDKVIYCDPFDSQRDGAADPRYEGHAIQSGKIILLGIASQTIYASYRIVEPQARPAAPRHDPRQVSNAGEWTPGDAAYFNRAQAVVNHAHPGKMPYVGAPADSGELERLRALVQELEADNAAIKAAFSSYRAEALEKNERLVAENERLETENTRLKAEVINLRNLAQLPDVKGKPIERTH